MKRTLYTYFTDRNQIAQPDATRVLGPIVAMPIHKKDDNDSLYNMLPEVVVTAKYPHEQRVIDTMNASNAEFMRRLRNNDKRAIHNQDGSYSTHVLGSADNIVFPAIQDVNGELKDYRGLPWQRTLDKAIQNNDYIEFPTEGDARYFGDHYKKYFPTFFSNFGEYQHTFENGGDASSNKGRRKGMMSPTRAPLVKRFWETDEEFKERTKGLTQEEIDDYNKEVDKEYADMSKHTAEERAQALSEAKKNGTYPKPTIVEKIGEASRKMHQSAKNSNSFDSLGKAQNLLSQGVNTEIATAKGIAESAQNYANEQAEKKQQQMRDIKKGFDAAATLGEWGAAGYTIGRLAVPRLLSNSTGVMGRVADFFTNNNVQLGVNTIGSLADGYQLLTADNKFDKYENGIELGGDTAGIIGGLDIVRNSNIFGRYSKPVDTALDVTGLSAASWDILKNIPPFKYYYGKLKDYVNGTNETEDDNQYADGGEMNAPKHWKELSMADKSDVIAAAVRNGVTTLGDIRKAWDDYADSGYQEETHEYLKGGYKPSASIKNRIANWEGSSMQTNRSFDAEAKDFWNAIPSNVRSKLSQQQADALYSYSYNVGAGNFKKRVVPSLERYFNGNGSVEDVQRHMYATKDKDYRGLAKRRAVERAMFAGQRVEDVPSFDYDYSSNSSPYGHRFTVNNNFQTAGYLGPIVNGNNGEYNNSSTNKLNVFMQALEDEPKQTIAESTPEPRYNALERLQNIYSMYGMDDYAQEIGKYNPFEGLMFAEGGKKSTDTKGVTSSNGQYHVNPADYWAVLGSADNKPLEVILPEVDVKAADPKNYRSSFHSEDIFPFMNVATAGLLNRGSVTQDARLLMDTYDAIAGNKSWKDVANSAIYGNEGIFENPLANLALDIAVPVGGAGIYKYSNMASNAAKNVANKAWHSTWMQYPRYYAGKLYYGTDVELPMLYRKLNTIPKSVNGKVDLSPIINRFTYENGEASPLITNMTTDVPVRSHASSWDNMDVLAFPGKSLLGKHVISTRPSDTFIYGDRLSLPASRVTYLSGRPRAIKIAQKEGLNTITSSEAQEAASKHIFGNNNDYSDYRWAMQNLSRNNFKSPTAKDYKFMDWVFQPQYKSNVFPVMDLSNPTIKQMEEMPEAISSLMGNTLYRRYLSNPNEWENVMYHPASSVEYQFRKPKGIKLKDELSE